MFNSLNLEKSTHSDDCNTCKDSKYIVTINSNGIDLDRWSHILSSIPMLGFTPVQAKIVGNKIIESKEPFKIFHGEQQYCFNLIDELIKFNIECSISKVVDNLYK